MMLGNGVGHRSLEPREANMICFGEPGRREGIFHLATETAGSPTVIPPHQSQSDSLSERSSRPKQTSRRVTQFAARRWMDLFFKPRLCLYSCATSHACMEKINGNCIHDFRTFRRSHIAVKARELGAVRCTGPNSRVSGCVLPTWSSGGAPPDSAGSPWSILASRLG